MNQNMTLSSKTESFGTICVVGAGYVGLTLGVTFADVGLNVVNVVALLHDESVDVLRQREGRAA